MKWVAVFLVGLLCGAAVVWWLAPGRYHYIYKTSRPLTLIDQVQGHETGVLPEGTLLLADVKLTRTPDLGWWGCTPVVFDDMWKAQDLGVVPWDGGGEIWERITLRASALNVEKPQPSAETETSTDPAPPEDPQAEEEPQP